MIFQFTKNISSQITKIKTKGKGKAPMILCLIDFVLFNEVCTKALYYLFDKRVLQSFQDVVMLIKHKKTTPTHVAIRLRLSAVGSASINLIYYIYSLDLCFDQIWSKCWEDDNTATKLNTISKM